jgi:Flp pilus assembly protein TadG
MEKTKGHFKFTSNASPLRQLWQCPVFAVDTRGVTAMMFALVVTALLGFAGLATEVGTWYLARSEAFNVADAIAMAGALETALQVYDPSIYDSSYDPAADTQLLQPLSAYTSATAASSPVTWTDQESVDAPATQAIVRIPFSTVLASLFTSQAVTVTATAVALVRPTTNVACALSLSGPISITQSQTSMLAGFPCYYASNYRGPGAVFLNPPTFDAQGITTTGACSSQTCPDNDALAPLSGGYNESGNILLARPIATFQPPTSNPYEVVDAGVSILDSQIICPQGLINPDPPASSSYCPPAGADTPVTLTSLVPSGGDAFVAGATNPHPTCQPTASAPYCGYNNMNLTISSDVTLAPGIYIFVNSSLTIQSGTVQCEAWSGNSQTLCDPNAGPSDFKPGLQGVTLVFAGSSPGKLIICGSTAIPNYCPGGQGATVLLSAPAAVSAPFSALSGVLFYRASSGAPPDGSADAPAVYIDDSGNSVLEGGMYFPGAYTSFTANTHVDPSTARSPVTCAVIVAGYLNLGLPGGGTSGSTSHFLGNGCSGLDSFNTPMPVVQAVQVVQ